MFYGQIMMQKYLEEPAISFCAIGDHTAEDDTPIQISEFGQGKGIDQLISKLVLWKSGNGNEHESYELATYFYESNVELMNAEMPFYFVTGDEGYFDQIDGAVLLKIFGKGIKQNSMNSKELWNKLMEKYNVFHIHKPYTSANYEKKIHQQWVETLGEERVLDIIHPKACIDLMLGAIALTSGKSLLQYVRDMKQRGQTEERIDEVEKALSKYAEKLSNGQIIPVKFKATTNNLSDKESIFNQNVLSVNKSSLKNDVNQADIDEITDAFRSIFSYDLDSDGIIYMGNLRNLKIMKSNEIPAEFICPLTKEILFDPVMTEDGNSYERKAIEKWLETHDFSPSGAQLSSKILLPNLALKQLIRDYLDSSN